MAVMRNKLEILVDVNRPVEEITECIIEISILHGVRQLEILKEIELWLGKTIEGAEAKKQNQEASQGPE